MPEIDDDLQGLLKELDIGPEISKEELPAPVPSPVPPLVAQVPGPPILEPPEELKVLPLSPVLEDSDLTKEKEPDTDLFKEEEGPADMIDLGEFIRHHDKDYTEAKQNLRADRAKADELVRLLLARVDDGSASNQETESLVQAVKCLVDSTGHLVRLLDSKSKFLSASKGSVSTLIQQNFGRRASTELEDILTQQLDEDEV